MAAHVVFWIFAAIAVVSAALCILQRNAVPALLWLVSTMFSLAGIYVLLNAQFIAAIQVLVYAGAVLVLFLFVIMLLNLDNAQGDLRGPGMVASAIAVTGLLAAELLVLSKYSPERLVEELGVSGPPLQVTATGGNVVADVAQPLFASYLLPFEVTSLLLLAAIVGAVVLAKRRI